MTLNALSVLVSRQQRRLLARQQHWYEWRCFPNSKPIGPVDDRGILPRRVRRAIAFARAKIALRREAASAQVPSQHDH